jgi:hypothetical protein
VSTSSVQLFRTATGDRRHLRACPHLLGKEVLEASEADGEICSWCDKELRGEGRQYFTALDDALRALGGPQANWPLIRDHLADVEPDAIWIPYSRSYVALGRGGRAVAWAGKTYVQPQDGSYVELPGFRPGSGGGAPAEPSYGETCPVHFVTRSLTGACERCDD